MALPNGLPQVSDLGSLLGSLKYDLVDIPLIDAPYTTVQNRAKMYDLSNDLSVNIGVNRITTQQVQQLHDETGPNGELVWAPVNDTFGQIRFVGRWSNWNSAYGTYIETTGDNTSYVEITFYGTGLNYLTPAINSVSDNRYTLNGGAESADILPGGADPTGNRGYSPNIVVPVVSNLSAGLYTVKIRNANSSGWLQIHAFEVLNESSSIRVNPGTSWKDGKKLHNSTQNISLYNSGFESGVLGTRGGRVAVYQKADGSIGKAVTPTSVSTLTIGNSGNSTDHSSEEIARTINFREFSAGRSDDFGLAIVSASDRAFTLNDGTTTLSIDDCNIDTAGYKEAIVLAQTANSALTIVFVGTGLDILNAHTSPPGSPYPVVSVNGVTVASGASVPWTTRSWVKIVSGLPYGTHVVRISQATGGTGLRISDFRIYQPKTPSIPSGSKLLGTYNILADHALAPTGDPRVDINTGVIWKPASREALYSGTWVVNNIYNYILNPVTLQNNGAVAGDFLEFTFFGTGFSWGFTNTGTGTYTLAIDGVNYTGSATITGAGDTWTPGSSLVTIANAGYLTVTGLTLRKHTVRLTKTSTAANYAYSVGFGVITPIHSYKTEGHFVTQNNLPVGSQGVADERETINDVNRKLSVVATNVTSPNTTSSSFVPMADMVCPVEADKDMSVTVSFGAMVFNSNSLAAINYFVALNGVPITPSKSIQQQIAAGNNTIYDTISIPLPKGYHVFTVFWSTNAGTATAQNRNLSVVEN